MSYNWWWPPKWLCPKGCEHEQTEYGTNPTTTTGSVKNLEEERLVGRIGVLTKRVNQLEAQFNGLYESCGQLMDRIRDLENQMLWNRPVEAIGRAVRSEREANDAGPATTTIHMFGDEVELEEQLRDGKKKISRYAMKELRKRIRNK